MNRRANILMRLRRWKTRAARPVVASFLIAYLSAGIAPCAAAAPFASDDRNAAVHEHVDAARSSHAHHAPEVVAHHGHDALDTVAPGSAPTPTHDRAAHCPHCPAGTAIAHDSEHSSCFALEDLTNVAAAHAKDAPQAIAPSFGLAAFTLPPALASPLVAPPLRAARVPPVPLNVRNCVFLI